MGQIPAIGSCYIFTLRFKWTQKVKVYIHVQIMHKNVHVHLHKNAGVHLNWMPQLITPIILVDEHLNPNQLSPCLVGGQDFLAPKH